MSGAWEIHGIFHFTINVSNFERSLAFYQQIGFRLLRDNRDVIWPEFVARNFGMKRAQARGALLAIGEGPEHTRIDLLEWLEPKLTDPQAHLPIEERVPRIVALRTRNARAAYEELRRKGVPFLTEPFIPDAALGIEAVVCCRDPDGLIVEFIEYAPGVTSREVSLRATTHGFEPGRFAARVDEFTRGDRARRALRRFLPIFGVALCVVLIPPHLPWITAVTLTGAVLAFQRYREQREILDVRGTCPACAAEQTLVAPKALPAIQRCPDCGAFLKLEEG